MLLEIPKYMLCQKTNAVTPVLLDIFFSEDQFYVYLETASLLLVKFLVCSKDAQRYKKCT